MSNESSPQKAIVETVGVIVMPSVPLVLYGPPTWLQSAFELKFPSVLNVIV